MKKISVVYEELSEDLIGWPFNGCLSPINKPIIDQTPFSTTISNIFTNPGSSSTILPFFGLDKNSTRYIIKTVNQLTPNEKYIYIINIFHIHVYTNLIDEITISNRVLDDARLGKAYIVFSYSNEGNLFYYKNRFIQLLFKLNVPKTNLIVVHADFNISNFSDLPATYLPINIFPWWIQSYSNFIDSPIPYSPNKLFVSYNKEIRPDRAKLLIEYKHNNLLDNGYVSCGHIHDKSLYNFSDNDKAFLKSIEGMSPDNLKIFGPDRKNPANILNKHHAVNSFVTITSETEARTDNIVYFTEKTFKPILLGHPFMLLGGQHQLEKLKEFGYKTFNKWWDESYDSEQGYENRIKKIVNNLLLLKSKSDNELVELRKDMAEVVAHNQQLYMKLVKSMSQDEYAIDIIMTLIS